MWWLLFTLSSLGIFDVFPKPGTEYQNSELYNILKSNPEFNTDIVGGIKVDISQYPYQVAVFPGDGKYMFTCGGSILNSKWILTAAHCLANGINFVYVRAGSTTAHSGGKVYSTTKFIIHPEYDPKTFDYDVAVISLEKNPISIDNKKTACTRLPSESGTVANGADMTITGWGLTEEKGPTSEDLLKTNVNIIDRYQCKNTYPLISPRMLCAGIPEGRKDACQGDSGGPLVETSSKVQYGIVSFGRGCGRPGVPGVYTFVPKVRQWIRTQTGV